MSRWRLPADLSGDCDWDLCDFREEAKWRLKRPSRIVSDCCALVAGSSCRRIRRKRRKDRNGGKSPRACCVHVCGDGATGDGPLRGRLRVLAERAPEAEAEERGGECERRS